MILKVFSNLNDSDSMILYFGVGQHNSECSKSKREAQQMGARQAQSGQSILTRQAETSIKDLKQPSYHALLPHQSYHHLRAL